MRAVESWAVRRMIIGANTRGYNAAFLTVLKAAQKAAGDLDGDIAAAVLETLSEAPNSLVWPDDDAIRAAFVGSTYYGSFTQERIRLVLGAIDEQLRLENKKTEPAVFDYEQLQIEHVMPKAWREHWSLPDAASDSAARQLAESGRDAVIHRMGNLTLVTPTFNQSVSNLSWSVKRPEFAAQSALQLNVPIAACDNWAEEGIAERAVWLAGVASRVWPHRAGLD